MPPKEKLTRSDIEQCAFELVRRQGYDKLNARALADVLGCSTMPLFRHFKNMDGIRIAVIGAATELYSEYISRGMKYPKPFKGIGMEYIRFAKEEPNLFRLFFMTPQSDVSALPLEDPNHFRVLKVASEASSLTDRSAEKLYREMWVFVHGIATLMITKNIEFDETEISDMLTDVYEGLRIRFSES